MNTNVYHAGARAAHAAYLTGVSPAHIRAAAIEASAAQRATNKRNASALVQLLNTTRLAQVNRGFARSQMPCVMASVAAHDRFLRSHGLLSDTQARAKLDAAYKAMRP